MWKPSSCQRSSCFCSSWENLSTFLSRLCCELPAPGKRWICCKLLWESQTVKLSPLSNTAADPPHVPERGVFLGHWHRIPPLGPGTGIGASGGLWWNWRVRQGRGWGVREWIVHGCLGSRGIWGGITAQHSGQMDSRWLFVLPNTLQAGGGRGGRGRWAGQEGGGRGERLKWKFWFYRAAFFPLWIIKRSSNPFVCPNMWCCERNPPLCIVIESFILT